MKCALVALLLISFPSSYAVPASPGTVLTFYITDDNLNTSHRGIDAIPTAGLVEFTINGTPIPGPSEMTETAVNSAMFSLKLTLPATVNGRPLQDGDVVVLTYHQRADYSGNPRTITQSVVLSQSSTSQLSSSTPSVRIGQDFLLRVNAPNWNLDSSKPDIIPMNLVEFRDGGFKTTLANPAFQVSTFGLRETGPNTNLFYANLKIPRQIDGHTLELGSVVEFSFTDPISQDPQETIIQLRIGTSNIVNNTPAPIRQPTNISVQASSSSGAVIQYHTEPNGEVAGLSNPACFPSSNSLFPVGKTTVICAGKDPSGNSAVRTFTVEVFPSRPPIPSSVRDSASSWCDSKTDSSDFKLIESLISKKIIILPKPHESGSQVLPSWFKNNACWWVTGKISDDDFVLGIQYLISYEKTKS